MNTRIASLVLASSLLGCVGSGADVTDEPDVEEVSQDLFANRAKLWGSDIPVCWMTPGFTTEKQWVRTQIEGSWQAVSRVKFLNWNNCATNTGKSIRIAIQDVRVNSQIGTDAATVTGPTMYLNFTYGTWNTACRNTKEFCIRTEAVHEFGHALGMLHEQTRPDTPNSVSCKEAANPAGTTVGGWDGDSVMNYCGTRWENWGRLSAGDVAGIRTLYGNSGAVYPGMAVYPYDHANAGQGLIRGESLTSRNGRFRATLQHDGNLVVYMGSTVLWQLGTYNTSTYSLILQGDGNLVAYNLDGGVRWYSGTQGTGGNVQLAMQDDGNLVLYRTTDWRAIWSSGTGGH